MKSISNAISSLLMLLIGCQGMLGQVSNTGELYVAEGTTFSTLEDFQNYQLGSLYNDGEMLLYADFSNDGLVYYSTSGLVRFEGFSGVQVIRGGEQTFLRDVVFNNSFTEAPFLLADTLTIEGTAHFRQGIIDSDYYGGVVVFEEGAAYTGASRNSHVDGPVEKRGDESFTFPVGDQRYYRVASLSEPEDASEKYETKYFKENSDKFYPHARKEMVDPPGAEPKMGVINYINAGEFWRITPVTGKSNLMLTLSWDESTTPEEIWQHPEAIHVVRWDAERNLWIDEGGEIDAADRSITTEISEYGIFTLGTVNMDEILPCEVVVYNAITPNDDNVNDYFLIDRPEDTGPLAVQIFNRWGTKIYESTDYGANGDLFRGYSEARGTIGNGKLPTGTYFYTLAYGCGSSGQARTFSKAGYLYLSYD